MEGEIEVNEIQEDNGIITSEDIKIFKDKVEKKKDIEFEDFNIYKKIKTDNKISPLIIYILEKAINVYNQKLNKEEMIKYGFENVGFGNYPGISETEKDNNKIYFEDDNAYVLYVSFNQEFIGNFWLEHQLLKDLLKINPDLTVNYSELNLDDMKNIKSETDKIINKSKKSKSSNKSESNKNSNKENSSENKSKKNKSVKKENVEIILDEKEIRKGINNKLFYRFSLGASFEYNALKYIIYGIKDYKLLPRIVFYPKVKYMDYEEIDTSFIIKEMKENMKEYYKNFKSIDLIDYKKERKEIKLEKNDIVFIESTFEFENGRNILSFMKKILKFIKLYENIGLIEDINNYKIKGIYLYDNNYDLTAKDIKEINKSIELIKPFIASYNNNKYNEIYENLQIIYCWPTLPILNNVITYNELKDDINTLNEKITLLINENIKLKEQVNNLIQNNQNYQNNNYNRRRKIPNFKSNHYYKRGYFYNNTNKYHQKNNYYYHDYNYVNNVNKKKYYVNKYYVNNDNYYN